MTATQITAWFAEADTVREATIHRRAARLLAEAKRLDASGYRVGDWRLLTNAATALLILNAVLEDVCPADAHLSAAERHLEIAQRRADELAGFYHNPNPRTEQDLYDTIEFCL